MALRTPSSFTAGRRVQIFGTTYQPGDAVPNSVVKSLRRLSALVSRRYLVPNVTLRQSKNARVKTPTPSDIGPAMRKGL